MKTFLPLALLVLLAGCAQPAPTAGSSPGSPPAPLPTLTRPSGPPSRPSDYIEKKNVVVGTVTRGGTGPCYGVTTDEGTPYAVYEDKTRALVKGSRVVVHTKPSRLRIDCGEGKLVEATEIEPLR